MGVNSYRPEEPALNAVFLMSSSAMANCKYPCARSKELKTLQLCTTCNASSMWGKGNASLDGNGIQFPIIHTDTDLPSFLLDQYNLGGTGTVR